MINKQIEYIRKQQKLSQKEFAEQIGVSRQMVSDWERDISSPSIEKLIIISNMFNISLDYLIKGVNYENKIKKESNIKDIFKISNINETNSFLFGKIGKMYVSTKENEMIGSSCVLGKSGSGKTRTIIIPNIYQMIKRNESGIVIDTKTELWNKTKDALQAAEYNVKILNFSNYKQSVGWNIISFLADLYKKDIFYCEKYIDLICDYLISDKNIHHLEYVIFKTILHEMLSNDKIDKNTTTLLNFIKYSNLDSFLNYIKTLNSCNAGYMLNLVDKLSIKNAFENLTALLERFFNSPSCMNVFNTNEFNFQELIDRKTIIFIQNNEFSDDINILNSMFIDLLTYYLYDYCPKENKINLFLDECCAMFKHLKTIKYLIKSTPISPYNTIMCFQSLYQLQMTDGEIRHFLNLFNNIIYLGTYSCYDSEFFSNLFDMETQNSEHELFIMRNECPAQKIVKDFNIINIM